MEICINSYKSVLMEDDIVSLRQIFANLPKEKKYWKSFTDGKYELCAETSHAKKVWSSYGVGTTVL